MIGEGRALLGSEIDLSNSPADGGSSRCRSGVHKSAVLAHDSICMRPAFTKGDGVRLALGFRTSCNLLWL